MATLLKESREDLVSPLDLSLDADFFDAPFRELGRPSPFDGNPPEDCASWASGSDDEEVEMVMLPKVIAVRWVACPQCGSDGAMFLVDAEGGLRARCIGTFGPDDAWDPNDPACHGWYLLDRETNYWEISICQLPRLLGG